MISAYWLIVGVILFYISSCLLCWRSDKKKFNGGICKKCGAKFKHFDTDSQGGRGYECGCAETTWVSWPRIGEKR